jgi:predicted metal-binding membrane protein
MNSAKLLSRPRWFKPVPLEMLLESLLRHDRFIVMAGLTVVTVVSWSWILAMSGDMYGSMTGASAWAMTGVWDLWHLLLLFAMWAVMMTAMMLPSAAPMLMLYIAVVRRSDETAVARRTYALAGGYLLIWALFSAVAAAGQRLLTAQAIVSPMMGLADPTVGGIVLILVALYQFTSLKRGCLDVCRSPLALITTYWRPGTAGAFAMGVRHGLYCLGCCWALMLLLFVGGVMNAWVIGGLTLFVLIEKVTPIGRGASYVGGIVLAALGVWLLVR